MNWQEKYNDALLALEKAKGEAETWKGKYTTLLDEVIKLRWRLAHVQKVEAEKRMADAKGHRSHPERRPNGRFASTKRSMALVRTAQHSRHLLNQTPVRVHPKQTPGE